MNRLNCFWARFTLLCLLLLSTAAGAEQGLLWHVSGKGADAYLFGTMHSEDPRVTRLPDVVEHHFRNADVLMLEVALDAQTEMAVALKMMLPPDSSLSSLLGQELGRRAREAMMERGVPPEVTERLQPWATILTLSMPQQKSGMVLDKLLYERAVSSGKTFLALESVEEQLEVFASLSLDEQKLLLQEVLEEYRSYPELFEQMTEAYLARDLDRLMAMNDENPISDDPQLQQKVMGRLLEQRNQRMVTRMEQQFSRSGVFVAVGALHLPGPQGLITSLRQRGYQLTVLY